MKSIIFALSLIAAVGVFAADQTKAQKAAELYQSRSFDEAGIANVEQAVTTYIEVIAEASDTDEELTLRGSLSQAYYFLGTAYGDEETQKAAYAKGIEQAELVTEGFAVKKSHKLSKSDIEKIKSDLTADQVLILCEGMYYKSANLAQWGKLNGITSSIGKLSEVTGNMESVEKLGHVDMHHHGPLRALGRVKFILPGIFRDLPESESLLKRAFKNTLAEGQKYSVEGYNNVYLAETLKEREKDSQAAQVLKAFIESDPATWAADSIPENQSALELATELAKEWNLK